ncbi:Mov34/MPN/PAD-1 family protein, partial [Prevotella sp. MGM2]|uniref:Mov34/MPN/PAD-1 family protein n=1 Tax=Prevotella sp. MGM2 TaxID=2033406 RepID=UPI000D0C3070
RGVKSRVPEGVKLTRLFHKQRAFENADLIIDASTSIAVERNLALDNSYGDARRSSVFLNPKGTELVLLYEDTERKYRLDLLEMTYYRMLIVDERLNDHLSVSEKQRTNSFSCRAESSIIDYDNVGLLASIASQQLKKLYASNDAKIAIWRISAGNSVVDYINIPLSDWQLFDINGVKVYIINDVISIMKEQRLSSGTLETGGVFFGCYDKDRQIIYVLHSHPAPIDSKHGPTSFVRGCNGLKEVQDSINLKTYYQVRYLGEWHSHPSGSNTPSTLDKKQFDEMSTDHLLQNIPFVQAIIGDNGVYVNALI